MAKQRKHWTRTFYRLPCEIDGLKSPPMMIPLTRFAEKYFYTKAECLTLLKDRHLFGQTFKKNLFVCPCPTSYKWTPQIIDEFWQRQ